MLESMWARVLCRNKYIKTRKMVQEHHTLCSSTCTNRYFVVVYIGAIAITQGNVEFNEWSVMWGSVSGGGGGGEASLLANCETAC